MLPIGVFYKQLASLPCTRELKNRAEKCINTPSALLIGRPSLSITSFPVPLRQMDAAIGKAASDVKTRHSGRLDVFITRAIIRAMFWRCLPPSRPARARELLAGWLFTTRYRANPRRTRACFGECPLSRPSVQPRQCACDEFSHRWHNNGKHNSRLMAR